MNLDYIDLLRISRDNTMLYISNSKSIFIFEIKRKFDPPIIRKFIKR